MNGATQVVIVDDNEDAALSLTMLLELEGISAASATDAESALALIERSRPLLCLIDIGLPGMDGFELARRLRDSPAIRHTTLIAVTGRQSDPCAGDGPFDHYWTKPVDPRRLLSEVQAVIRAADRP
jgi:CheY-like chemotaxis protein